MQDYAQLVNDGRWVMWFIITLSICLTTIGYIIVIILSKLPKWWKGVKRTRRYRKLWNFLFK